jgi:ABC-type sugar transport system substrate-binding protein
MIAQGVDVIFLPPREDKPLGAGDPCRRAKGAGIPVFLIDRDVDQRWPKPGEDYVTFIGSDFIEEGKRIAEWLVKNANGKSKIIELEGTYRLLARQRSQEGLRRRHQAVSRVQDSCLAVGRLRPRQGPPGAETLLQAHPGANIIYAHNDEMALGAIAGARGPPARPGQGRADHLDRRRE